MHQLWPIDGAEPAVAETNSDSAAGIGTYWTEWDAIREVACRSQTSALGKTREHAKMDTVATTFWHRLNPDQSVRDSHCPSTYVPLGVIYLGGCAIEWGTCGLSDKISPNTE